MTATPPASMDGYDVKNFVNRLVPAVGGLQLEQSTSVRSSVTNSGVTALSVKELFDCLREGEDAQLNVGDNLTQVSSDAGSTYYDGAGQCDGYIVELTFSNTNALSDVSFSAELSATTLCSAWLDGARVFANIYWQDTSGVWQRLGGGWRDVSFSGGYCVYGSDSYYEPVTVDVPAGGGTYRVVARAHHAAATALPVRVLASTP